MRSARRGLGLIPSFQFARSPENPEGYIYTDKLQFTAEVPNQLTVQPVFPGYPTSGDRDLQGLGITMVNPLPKAAAGAGISGAFDSWWWTNRKWIAIGTLGVLGLVLVGMKVMK